MEAPRAMSTSHEPIPMLSIIVPVFNEQATVRQLLDALLMKPLQGGRKEVIIVESNSTDGSREIGTSANRPA